jgi:hypothetical protein
MLLFSLTCFDLISNELQKSSAVVAGFKSILATAASYDVTTLAFPLMLATGEEMLVGADTPSLKQRAEMVLQILKELLLSKKEEDMDSLILVLPTVTNSDSLLKKVQSLVESSFTIVK